MILDVKKFKNRNLPARVKVGAIYFEWNGRKCYNKRKGPGHNVKPFLHFLYFSVCPFIFNREQRICHEHAAIQGRAKMAHLLEESRRAACGYTPCAAWGYTPCRGLGIYSIPLHVYILHAAAWGYNLCRSMRHHY